MDWFDGAKESVTDAHIIPDLWDYLMETIYIPD